MQNGTNAMAERERFSPKHFVGDIGIAALAFTYSVWAITGSGKVIIAKGFALLLAGIPVYVAMKWWQQPETVSHSRGAGDQSAAASPTRFAVPARELSAAGTGEEGVGRVS
jgi:basic amino acid/polyamine antiporter, APA family